MLFLGVHQVATSCEIRMRSCFSRRFALAMMAIALWGLPPGAAAQPSEAPEAAIRAALEKWTADFNSGHADEICSLFSSELRYDFRAQPERNYTDICNLLHRSLKDTTKKYFYALHIKEILLCGELAVVRLVWTLRITAFNSPAPSLDATEPGMDILRRQANGSWKIIRYIAYQE